MVAMIDKDWVRRSVMESFTTRWNVPPKRTVELRSTTRIVEPDPGIPLGNDFINEPEPEPEPEPVLPVQRDCCALCGEPIGAAAWHRDASKQKVHTACAPSTAPHQGPVDSVAKFCMRFESELKACQRFYGLGFTPEPDMINTYEGWQKVGRQVVRGAKSFKFTSDFAIALADLKVFPDAAVGSMRFKARQYREVMMFVADKTEESSPTKSRRR